MENIRMLFDFSCESGTSLLTLFITLSVINVILQTVKSIVTIKCGRLGASGINALAFWLYTYVTFFTAIDGIGLGLKALITGVVNLIGVYIVKYFEEKMRKDKMWRVELTVSRSDFYSLMSNAEEMGLTYNYIDIEKYFIVNFYCPTQSESQKVKDLVKKYNVKYFATETKIL